MPVYEQDADQALLNWEFDMFNSLRTAAVIAALFIPLAAQSAPKPTTRSDMTPAPFAADLVLNGTSSNGIQFNGRFLNGWSLNGLSPNGMKVNGWILNGLRLNGARLNGWSLNGLKWNGMPFDGKLSRGDFVRLPAGDATIVSEADWSTVPLANVRVRLPLAR